MRDTKHGSADMATLGHLATSGLSTPGALTVLDEDTSPTVGRRDEASMKVLELMAESFHGNNLDSAVRPPVAAASPKRTGRPTIGLAARTAGAAMRTGPSPAAATASVNKALTAVSGRIVSVMVQFDLPRDAARLELALLARLHRSLLNHANRAATDVVLCDSIAEFADSVQPVLFDLEAGGVRRVRRFLEFDRELLAELSALGGTDSLAELKPRLRDARALVDKLADYRELSPQESKVLEPAAQSALSMYKRLSEDLERLCPRQHGTLLDEMTKP